MRCAAVAATVLLLLGCAQTHRPDFELQGDFWFLSGEVRSDDGQPVAFASVSAHDTGGGCLITTYDTTTTNQSGQYRLRIPVYTRTASIHVDRDEWPRGSERRQWDSSERRMDFTLATQEPGKEERGVEVAGVVTDERGVPLDDVAIRHPGARFARSDRAGHFTLKGVPTGRMELSAEHPDYAPLTMEVDSPSDDLRLTLRDGAHLQVTVRGAEECFGVVVGLGHVAHHDEDAGGFELVGIDSERALELEYRCSEEHLNFFVRRRLEPPLPPAVTLEFPRLRPVRIEVTNPAHQPIRPLLFRFDLTRNEEGTELTAFLQSDDAGVMSVLVPEGPQHYELTTLRPPTGQIARGWLHGETTLPLTLDEGPKQEP